MKEAYKIQHQLELINAIKANDSIALKDFYTSNYRKVEVMVLKNSGSQAHAKDVYQDAFIALGTTSNLGNLNQNLIQRCGVICIESLKTNGWMS